MALKERLVTASLCFTALVSLLFLFVVVAYIVANGIGAISLDFLLESPYRFEQGGIFPQIIGSLCLVLICLLVAVPLGVASAIYLAEYAPDTLITRSVRFFVECLAGIPSIVKGLFGLVFLVYYLHLGISMLAGGLTLGFMILPWTVRASEEAIKAVPQSYREASLALGATKLQTIRTVVLKSAYPGIITGILLGMGKAIGETAVVLLTAARVWNPSYLDQSSIPWGRSPCISTCLPRRVTPPRHFRAPLARHSCSSHSSWRLVWLH